MCLGRASRLLHRCADTKLRRLRWTSLRRAYARCPARRRRAFRGPPRLGDAAVSSNGRAANERGLRIGLVASGLHRSGPSAALLRLLRPLEAALREELRPELQVVGLTHDALVDGGVLQGYPGLHRLPTRR